MGSGRPAVCASPGGEGRPDIEAEQHAKQHSEQVERQPAFGSERLVGVRDLTVHCGFRLSAFGFRLNFSVDGSAQSRRAERREPSTERCQLLESCWSIQAMRTARRSQILISVRLSAPRWLFGLLGDRGIIRGARQKVKNSLHVTFVSGLFRL